MLLRSRMVICGATRVIMGGSSRVSISNHGASHLRAEHLATEESPRRHTAAALRWPNMKQSQAMSLARKAWRVFLKISHQKVLQAVQKDDQGAYENDDLPLLRYGHRAVAYRSTPVCIEHDPGAHCTLGNGLKSIECHNIRSRGRYSPFHAPTDSFEFQSDSVGPFH